MEIIILDKAISERAKIILITEIILMKMKIILIEETEEITILVPILTTEVLIKAGEVII